MLTHGVCEYAVTSFPVSSGSNESTIWTYHKINNILEQLFTQKYSYIITHTDIFLLFQDINKHHLLDTL